MLPQFVAISVAAAWDAPRVSRCLALDLSLWLCSQRRAWKVLAAAAQEAAPTDGAPSDALSVDFDNVSDPEATIITVSGRDKADLLMALTGGFNALELRVISATITSTEGGRVLDQFRVTGFEDEKVWLRRSGLRAQDQKMLHLLC